jgi:putative Holliday junction resolvase
MPAFLGIDYGPARIGIAASDPLGMLASPLVVLDIRAGGGAVLFAWIATRLEKEPFAAFVLGYPDRFDERAAPVCAQIDALALELQRRFALPVHLQDEQFSTRRAQERINARGRRKKTAHAPGLDAVAAAVILQDFLDSR